MEKNVFIDLIQQIVGREFSDNIKNSDMPIYSEINSIEMVNLIVLLEEKFDVSLEDCLSELDSITIDKLLVVIDGE